MITQEQQQQFCNQCTFKSQDAHQNVICGLTDKAPNFTQSCDAFTQKQDLEEKEVLEDAPQTIELSPEQLAKFKLDENLPKGAVASIVVGILCALIWGGITVITNMQIGYMAVGVGFAVGLTMRGFGKGLSGTFGIVAAIIAVLSCYFGNFFSLIGFLSNEMDMSYAEILEQINFISAFSILLEESDLYDLLFYGIAAYESFKLAPRRFTEEELAQLQA